MTCVGAWLAAAADVPRIDGELLVGKLLEVSRAQLLTHLEQPLNRCQLQVLDAQLEALRNGVPTAYVLQQQEFWGLPFAVSPAVLIPRPETELLVEKALQISAPGARVLDLGTGSGAIAVTLAHERPDLAVTAVDSSPAALAVAADNARMNQVQVCCIQSDWFAEVNGLWDVIVSNPPYIAVGDPHLPALRYEPQQALVAGPEGLNDLQHIIQHVPAYLRPGGTVLLEHGYNQAPRVAAMMHRAGLQDVQCATDLAGIARVSSARTEGGRTDRGDSDADSNCLGGMGGAGWRAAG